MKRINFIILNLSMLITVFVFSFSSVSAASRENFNTALDEFIVNPDYIMEVSDNAGNAGSAVINRYLSALSDIPDNQGFGMVYVNSGTHKISSTLHVPKNVVLVLEKGVVFKDAGSRIMVQLDGAVFGGTYDGSLKTENIIRFSNVSFNRNSNNGIVLQTSLKNSKVTAIQINGKAKNAYVRGNVIDNCKVNGISSYRGGHYDQLVDNRISNIGNKSKGSGIDITQSDVNVISNNVITNAKGHGISTDTETHSGQKHSCSIKEISGNTISNIKHHGIWVEHGVKISNIKNNSISNTKYNCIGVDKNASINNMDGNKIKSAKHSLMMLKGKKSKVTIGNNNSFTSGKDAGIYIGKSSKLVIKGSNNYIKNNKKNGIQINKKGVLRINGKTTITKNRWGINMSKKAKAYINNCIIKKKKKGAIFYMKGAVVKKKACKIKGKVYRAK